MFFHGCGKNSNSFIIAILATTFIGHMSLSPEGTSIQKSKMLAEFRICDFALMNMLKSASQFQSGINGT